MSGKVSAVGIFGNSLLMFAVDTNSTVKPNHLGNEIPWIDGEEKEGSNFLRRQVNL